MWVGLPMCWRTSEEKPEVHWGRGNSVFRLLLDLGWSISSLCPQPALQILNLLVPMNTWANFLKQVPLYIYILLVLSLWRTLTIIFPRDGIPQRNPLSSMPTEFRWKSNIKHPPFTSEFLRPYSLYHTRLYYTDNSVRNIVEPISNFQCFWISSVEWKHFSSYSVCP